MSFEMKVDLLRRMFDELDTPFSSSSALRARLETVLAQRISYDDLRDLLLLLNSRSKDK